MCAICKYRMQRQCVVEQPISAKHTLTLKLAKSDRTTTRMEYYTLGNVAARKSLVFPSK